MGHWIERIVLHFEHQSAWRLWKKKTINVQEKRQVLNGTQSMKVNCTHFLSVSLLAFEDPAIAIIMERWRGRREQRKSK